MDLLNNNLLDNDLLNDDLTINNNNIALKYFQIKNKLDSYENFLLEFYSREIIDNIKNNYETFLLSDIKAYSKLSTIYQNFLATLNEYQLFLDTKPLENFDETKLYIDKKIKQNFDETKLYIDNKMKQNFDETKLYIDNKIKQNFDDKIKQNNEVLTTKFQPIYKPEYIGIEDQIIQIFNKIKIYENKYPMLFWYYFKVKWNFIAGNMNTSMIHKLKHEINDVHKLDMIKNCKTFSYFNEMFNNKIISIIIFIPQGTEKVAIAHRVEFEFSEPSEELKINDGIYNAEYTCLGQHYEIKNVLFKTKTIQNIANLYNQILGKCNELYDIICNCENIGYSDDKIIAYFKNIKLYSNNSQSLYDLYKTGL